MRRGIDKFPRGEDRSTMKNGMSEHYPIRYKATDAKSAFLLNIFYSRSFAFLTFCKRVKSKLMLRRLL